MHAKIDPIRVDSGPFSNSMGFDSACDGGTPLTDAGRPLAHGGEAVSSRAQQRGEPVSPMVGQRQGNLGDEHAVNTQVHAETVPTLVDLIASHRRVLFASSGSADIYLARRR